MKPKKIYFTPGPAQLYPSFEAHLQEAIDEQISSISHRSNQFRSIYQDTFENLKALFNLPDDVAVLFTGSATEIWERILMNCVEEESFHLVNGEFSKRFYEFASELHKTAIQKEVGFGEGFQISDIHVDYKAELIALTHNETSSGVMMNETLIHQIKANNSNRLVAVDMVSSAPYPHLDFNLVDTAFFSVQKGFGMPAGLGVWIANHRCLAKAEVLEKKGLLTGSYHRLTNLWKNFEKYETPSTPNVLGIYLLGKITKDMLEKGLDKIREEIDLKAKMVYDFLSENEKFEIFVQNPAHRSSTVIVANTQDNAGEIIKKLAEKGLIVGSGYKSYKDSQIRIANFPATSVEEIEMLLEEMKNL